MPEAGSVSLVTRWTDDPLCVHQDSNSTRVTLVPFFLLNHTFVLQDNMPAILDFLPPPSSFSFIPLLYLQCLLLHPRFNPTLSRFLRLLLTPVTVYLAYTAPSHGFTPRDTTRGLNAGWSFMCMDGIWKSLEWGLVKDNLTEYDYVGFGRKEKELQREEKELEKKGSEAEPDEVTQARLQEGWVKVLLSQLHLFTSMRHLGYRSYTGAPSKPCTTATFLRRALLRTLGTHIGMLVGVGWVTADYSSRRVALAWAFPSLLDSPQKLETSSQLLAFVSLGLIAWQGLALAQSLQSLLSFAIIEGGRAIGLPFDKFETREYPPLFTSVWAPTSVKQLW